MSLGSLQNYGKAVGFVACATVAQAVDWPWVQPSLSPLFTAAVLFSAIYGGLRPALLATGLSAVASAFFFLRPTRSLPGAGASRVPAGTEILSVDYSRPEYPSGPLTVTGDSVAYRSSVLTSRP